MSVCVGNLALKTVKNIDDLRCRRELLRGACRDDGPDAHWLSGRCIRLAHMEIACWKLVQGGSIGVGDNGCQQLHSGR